jgi:hypothetical protein
LPEKWPTARLPAFPATSTEIRQFANSIVERPTAPKTADLSSANP